MTETVINLATPVVCMCWDGEDDAAVLSLTGVTVVMSTEGVTLADSHTVE